MTMIDRDELLKHEVMIITKGNAAFHGVPSSLIETAPVIDPKSLRHMANWIPVDPNSDVEWECSKCEFVMSTGWDGCEDFNYCPCCGARMVGNEEDG